MPKTTTITVKISGEAISPLEVGSAGPFDEFLPFPAEETRIPKIETKLFQDRNSVMLGGNESDRKRFAQAQKMVEKLLDWR